MSETTQNGKPDKKGFWHWIHQVFQNNKDLDSTGLLIIIGGGAIINQFLCAFVPEYDTSNASKEITRMYETALVATVMYFFGKGKQEVGDVSSKEKDTK